MINVHASLLPRYRGAAPVHRAIMAAEPETGVTIMRVVKALDAGPMLAAARRPIGRNETSLDVEHDLAAIGASLLVATLDRLARGEVAETPQDESAASYARRLTKDDGLIDWSQPAGRVHDQIRGLHPWPHAHSYLQGSRLILLRSVTSEATAGAPPGTILAAHGNDLHVATGAGVVRADRDTSRGKAADERAGFPVRPPADGRRSVHSHGMIAPARVAAFEILSAVSAGRADLSSAIAQCPDDADAMNAIGRSPPRSQPASSACGRRSIT